tara:strand:- start:28671 stop:29519 length:849 start_codon:yes stop_codon:yes gene_type:complete
MNTFTLDKKIIKKSFSKAASTYDAYSTLQKNAAKDLLKLINKINIFPLNSESYFALDIGCGTGTLAFCVDNVCPHASLFGCDFSLPMLFKAKEKDRDRSTRFLTSDCDELPFKEFLFDSVFSNLTYQWVPQIDRSFQEVWRVLKPGGLFLFSTLGPRTLEELQTSYKKTGDAAGNNGRFVLMKFHDVENLSSNLKKAGFEILSMESVVKNKSYENLWDLLRTLKATGASPPFHTGNKSLARGCFLKETAKTYQKYFPASNGSGILASYDIIYAAAKKSTSPF